MRATLLAVLALAAAGAGPARADCAGGMDEVSRQVDSVRDERTRELLRFDLKRAHRESGEGDEDECQEAVDHARGLIRDQN